MKNIIYIGLILILLFSGCKEEYVGQYPIDSTPPSSVTNVVVENLSGKVKISYKIPNETDVLYVKAVYTNTVGETKEVRSSIFKDNLEISGFGRSKKQTIQLITVDRSQNESKPVPVEIEPFDSSIYETFETIKVVESWGGFKLFWENPLNEQLIVKVYRQQDDEWTEIETFYSTETSAAWSVRGLDPVLQSFSIVIKDVYENATDTYYADLTPFYEIELPAKSQFKEMPLAPGYVVSGWSNGWAKLWDGIALTDDSKYYMGPQDPQPYFTVDMGKTYKLSRTKIWGRVLYAYSLHNPRYFEIWGTNSIEATRDATNWDGWELLLEGESYKPSGSNVSEVTAEDKAYADAGEEFEFRDDVPPVRYIRFRSIQNWTKTNALHLNEWTLWGQESN